MAAPSARASELFFALTGIPEDERVAWVEARCAGDAGLRREIEELLASLDRDDGPLDVAPSPAARQAPIVAPGARIGDFTLLDVLGTGGTGIVYRALQRRPVRTVALKVLRDGLDSTAVRKRFEVEAEILARLQHPGIAQVYAAHPGDASTPPFIAMELVEGLPLTEFANDRRLAIAERLELLARVCDAVQHAHQRGIIHRDLKPANILVGADKAPRVLDFGVARATRPSPAHSTIVTEKGQLLGTLPFMSPEQVAASPDGIDTRADIYSLGVILFRLLTGRVPFVADDPSLPELARRIVEEPAPKLSSAGGTFQGDLEVIVARALAKDKDRRYASAADLAADLRRHAAGRPIAASADSAWYVLRTRVARYRNALAASLIVLAGVAALASYATVQRSRANVANVQLQRELSGSNLERGRLLASGGHVLGAEALAWPELFRAPDSRHALWTLAEIYSRQPSLWARVAHPGGTNSVRFNRDARLVLTAGNDHVVRILDRTTGRELRTFPPFGARVLGAVFSHDDSHVLSWTADGAVRYLDADEGAPLHDVARHDRPVQAAVALPERDAFVVSDLAGRVATWRFHPLFVETPLGDRATPSRAVAVDPAGRYLFAGFDDGTVVAWDARTRREIWSRQVASGMVTALAGSPDGRTLVAGGMDQVVHFLDSSSGVELKVRQPRNGTVRRMSFDASGRRLVIAGWWRTVVWDLASPGDAAVDRGVAEGSWDARISADGAWLVTCEEVSGRVRLWELGATMLERAWPAQAARVSGLAITSGGRAMLTSGHDGRLRTWDLGHARMIEQRSHGQRINALAEAPTGEWLAVGGDAGVTAWSPAIGVSATLPIRSDVTALAFDARGALFVGGRDGGLSSWELKPAGAVRLWMVPNLGGEVTGLAAHGTLLAVSHRERTLALYDAGSGRRVRTLGEQVSAFGLAFHPSGRQLLAGTWRGTVHVLDVATGGELLLLNGHTRLVAGVAIDEAGATVATASRDGTTRLWDLATGAPLATVARRDVGAERVRFLPGGRGRLAIGYDDGVVQIVETERFLEHVAGNAEYSRGVFAADAARFPRSREVLAWSRRVLGEAREKRRAH